MQTLEYRLETEPETRLLIPSDAKGEATKLILLALNSGQLPTDSVYTHLPLILKVLGAYRSNGLRLKPAIDLLTLNIAEYLLQEEPQPGLIGPIIAAEGRLRKKYSI